MEPSMKPNMDPHGTFPMLTNMDPHGTFPMVASPIPWKLETKMEPNMDRDGTFPMVLSHTLEAGNQRTPMVPFP